MTPDQIVAFVLALTSPAPVDPLFPLIATGGADPRYQVTATACPRPLPAVTGGNLTSVAANACRTAIAQQTGRPVSDVAVFDVAESEAGVGVMATVAGAEAPWACQSSPDGRVAGVTYTGSEGSL